MRTFGFVIRRCEHGNEVDTSEREQKRISLVASVDNTDFEPLLALESEQVGGIPR